MASQGHGLFQTNEVYTYVTEMTVWSKEPTRYHATPAPDQDAGDLFDTRVRFQEATHTYTLPGSSVPIPNSTLVASLAAPKSCWWYYSKQDTTWTRKGSIRHAAWDRFCAGKAFHPVHKRELQDDPAYLHVHIVLKKIMDNPLAHFLPGEAAVLCHVGAFQIGARLDQAYELDDGNGTWPTCVMELKSGKPPAKKEIAEFQVPYSTVVLVWMHVRMHVWMHVWMCTCVHRRGPKYLCVVGLRELEVHRCTT
jgi:hypothetical protein